jgi:hemerythrin superfamily protein
MGRRPPVAPDSCRTDQSMNQSNDELTFEWRRMELLMDKNDADDTAAEHSGGAVNVLTDDHNRVRGLFKYFAQLEGTGPTAARIAVVEDICKELVIHAAIEEELFYPAARNAINDDELVNEAEVEHGAVQYLINQLLPVNKDDARFCAKVKVLREYIKHHMDEEEKGIFPKVKQTKIDLSALGQQLMERREALRNQLKSPEHVTGFEPVKYFVGRS